MKTAREQAEEIVSHWATSKECYHPLTVYPTALRDAITAALEEKDRELAEAVKLLEPFAEYAKAWEKVGPAIAKPDDHLVPIRLLHCRAARAFVAKHTHAEKPDGKLQKPLDTHAKPL